MWGKVGHEEDICHSDKYNHQTTDDETGTPFVV